MLHPGWVSLSNSELNLFVRHLCAVGDSTKLVIFLYKSKPLRSFVIKSTCCSNYISTSLSGGIYLSNLWASSWSLNVSSQYQLTWPHSVTDWLTLFYWKFIAVLMQQSQSEDSNWWWVWVYPQDEKLSGETGHICFVIYRLCAVRFIDIFTKPVYQLPKLQLLYEYSVSQKKKMYVYFSCQANYIIMEWWFSSAGQELGNNLFKKENVLNLNVSF